MTRFRGWGCLRTLLRVATDGLRFVSVAAGSRTRLAAENLFLRKQLAHYIERQVKPRRANDATRITLVILSRWIDWRRILTVVQSDTLIRCSGDDSGGMTPRLPEASVIGCLAPDPDIPAPAKQALSL
jgi:hypothetical protein